jgi:glycosyltransferase involved in cell wall biosynthesis
LLACRIVDILPSHLSTRAGRLPRGLDANASRPLRIAQISPLYERVPPKLYGGTERVVGALCDALTRRGHEVTLFASGDSTARARLCAPTPRALRRNARVEEQTAAHMFELGLAFDRAGEFDIIHSHVEHLGFPVSRVSGVPTVHTLHSRLDTPSLRPLYAHFRGLSLVSISDAQREPLGDLGLNWVRTVYHGLVPEEYPVGRGLGGFLAFFGRIAPEKGPDTAITVAKRIGMPLKIAAKVDRVDHGYFEHVIRPMLDGSPVEFIGEVGGADRVRFLGDARALLFPIDWPEPFGLVMIEALACGTPVIAFGRGSVPEVIRHERTGFIVGSIDDMVQAVGAIDRIDRGECRREVERRFTDAQMAIGYEDAYARVLAQHSRQSSRHG